ncbi:hypothetical protein BU15DRAFT_83613 [Melanogaster broomeanus]|nr:hypothetical protein BU15DRAFT_83613 [Melanogaster broomeanus]
MTQEWARAPIDDDKARGIDESRGPQEWAPIEDDRQLRQREGPTRVDTHQRRQTSHNWDGVRDPLEFEPVKKSFRISVQEERLRTRTVTRRQLPITAAYACTDYRAQGQTISALVIDIGTPPSGGLSLFNLYVAMSRSGRKRQHPLLRNFDEKFFKAAQVPEPDPAPVPPPLSSGSFV